MIRSEISVDPQDSGKDSKLWSPKIDKNGKTGNWLNKILKKKLFCANWQNKAPAV